MLIDWFTVGAQALNFVVLVWLMKRFLYRPVLAAIDAREQRIAAALADADRKEVLAGQERDTYAAKVEEIDRSREKLLEQAKTAAEKERGRLVDEARNAATAQSARRDEALHGEMQRLQESIVRRTRDEVFAIARKVLADLASTSLEAAAADAFAHRLCALETEDHERMKAALKGTSASAPARVRSAFELPDGPRAVVRRAVDETFGPGTELAFETAPDGGGGIELLANGRQVGWTIAGQLESLQQALDEWVAPPSVKPAPSAAAR